MIGGPRCCAPLRGEPGGATADDAEKITAKLGRANSGGKPADLAAELARLMSRAVLLAYAAGALSAGVAVALAAGWSP